MRERPALSFRRSQVCSHALQRGKNGAKRLTTLTMSYFGDVFALPL